MPKSVAVVQSNYIPWKGYFDLIAAVDEFILYDDVQYTRRDWRNRNQIKTSDGPLWLTIPMEVKGKYLQPIRETRIAERGWAARHWKTIAHNYAKAAHFEEYAGGLEAVYRQAGTLDLLSDVNRLFLQNICDLLGIGTKLSWSMDYKLIEGRSDRLADLCRQAGATHYLSGPSARGYLDVDRFATMGMSVTFFDYQGYPEYRQLYAPFLHTVSVIDLILNEGAAARSFMKSAR